VILVILAILAVFAFGGLRLIQGVTGRYNAVPDSKPGNGPQNDGNGPPVKPTPIMPALYAPPGDFMRGVG
jgi:hypothetical protein